MNGRDADRKTLLADAAVEVIGGEGLRALTHRAVDARAGLPQGTCGYHYPSRAALLAAALERIAVLDEAMLTDEPDLAVAIGVLVGPAGTRTRARLMLMLDPQARAELGAVAGGLAAGFVDRATTLLGSPERARLAIALIDGLILDELVRGVLPTDERRRRVAEVLESVTAGR